MNDRGGWGTELWKECVRRGWDCNLFTGSREVMQAPQKADYVFMRLDQHAKRLADERHSMEELKNARYNLIPNWETGRLFEDKLEQAKTYLKWMPNTWFITLPEAARDLVAKMPYPFLSKSRTSSASGGLRMINTPEEATAEIEAVFGLGLATHSKLGENLQKGYLIWTEFLAGNKYDYRVVATGRMRMMLRRHNRPEMPGAPGSGKLEEIEELNDETKEVLNFANEFFLENHLHFCAIDVVRKAKAWRLTGTTVGWRNLSFQECQYFNPDGVAVQYVGAEMWRLLCDEIEEGVFG